MKSLRSHTRHRTFSRASLITALLIALLLSGVLPTSRARSRTQADTLQQPSGVALGAIYSQTNLVSDIPGVALVEDRNLQTPWGVAVNSTSPFWVVNFNRDLATLYKGDVAGSPLVPNAALPSVGIPNVPTLLPAPALPTAVVANNTNDFLITTSGGDLPPPPAPAQFIFATQNGGINAWQPSLGTVANVVRFQAGHSYTGIAIGNNASGNLLYVADFANGNIDVFDKNFSPTTVSGNFVDATIPANFHPYNIQNFGGSLYVAYAQFNRVSESNRGFVRKFNTDGVRDVAFAINNGPLWVPWGMALAPANFGPFSNLLLVGNNRRDFFAPSISAFSPTTGTLVGSMTDGSGAPLQIEQLRALTFGNGTNGGDTNTLYFSADIFDLFSGDIQVPHHGLFGSLKPVQGLPATLIKFSNNQYFTSEGAGHFDVTVTRSGDVTGTSTVNYATVDGSLSQRSGYEIAVGKLTFNPGETSKTFRVLIVNDNLVDAGSTQDLNLVLSNPTGAALVSPNQAQLGVMGDEGDTNKTPLNIIDDAQGFVRQHYFDFLNREPDTAGLDFWTNQITSCGADQNCIDIRRINVSAAFFLSIEFQKTGLLAYLTERCATGALPRYGAFMRDVQALQKNYVQGAPDSSAKLEANIRAFFDEFVTRPEFVAKYGGLTNLAYVDALLASGQIATTTGRVSITRLDGSQVVPPVNTPATGVAIGRLSQQSLDTVTFRLSLKNLSSSQTSAHLHGPALAGANAPAIATLPTGEFQDFTVSLTAPQGVDMRNGRLYIDVHTQNNPDGEIRGQIGPIRFQRDVIAEALDNGLITRAEALRLIVEDGDFRQRELNSAFVLMEYFGYLRRNPDDPPDNNLAGFNFWLGKLNQFNGNFVAAEMVKSFITSTEYRSRFGPP